jgi:hypothetical protein
MCGEEFPTEEELRRHIDLVQGDGATPAVGGPAASNASA